ncbi:hypothetical protein Rhe02_25330 [Rhizocola hellebori]|uniref:Uncharacterized protein n=1 Tax=Rhizocola hellebori TaxID=1392758 RepID=A0A8J3VFU1_9ACTN|nr:hypothetical protein [Rhizocola hellebori]GIH04466.1 hypothetical protein Rhe02_25330 [Rhizocola hellebori]
MKLVAFAFGFVLASCTVAPPRWYEATDSTAQRPDLDWGHTVLLLDPMTTDLSTVDDLHGQRKRAVCKVGADERDAMLQLCRDKGFDAVSFVPDTASDQLRRRARQLRLPVLTAPAGT